MRWALVAAVLASGSSGEDLFDDTPDAATVDDSLERLQQQDSAQLGKFGEAPGVALTGDDVVAGMNQAAETFDSLGGPEFATPLTENTDAAVTTSQFPADDDHSVEESETPAPVSLAAMMERDMQRQQAGFLQKERKFVEDEPVYLPDGLADLKAATASAEAGDAAADRALGQINGNRVDDSNLQAIDQMNQEQGPPPANDGAERMRKMYQAALQFSLRDLEKQKRQQKQVQVKQQKTALVADWDSLLG
mmetsp:Transcript_53480/g.117388  ORF Transcript_53480/g.117388 Transcript_53480/m.117388 type:complete len:249 (+) Transcript_53480:122-868(+)|eukprot:CAMPEP_0204276632 /NCGR_PEP_ID=MMETSP0468-20130131/28543_1 /ASSEMBLY_ACC=CAM_ASM_000383 /TAXON_ID=2969 /ORGANISM="Oxyrrhis marina" /LENGTH=248 /DNA_ID=CAMNT_0051253287 /DNA_START=106 /DNA_END=852 /DNA_ORIENTATION=+